MPINNPKHIALPATVDFAFWASMMTSWLAQEAEGLLDVAKPAVWLFALASIGLAGGAVVTAIRQPWQLGSMRLAPTFAKIIFIVMIVVTAAWIGFGTVFSRAPSAQILYGVCALLSSWSAFAIFVTLRNFEAGNGNGSALH
jgi:hypothetical protein